MGFIVTRIGGADRTETAEKLALHFYPNGSKTVILASALDYGSTLAAAELAVEYNYPLLLTWESQLSPSALRGLEELNAKIVVLVGFGINETVENTLKELGYETYWIGRSIEPPPFYTQTSTTPQPQESKYSFLKGVLITLVVSAPIFFYLGRKVRTQQNEILNLLNEKEKAVLRAILEHGGEIKQEDLPELVGYSRPTISKVIQELENKGLIKREKSGKTFVVKIERKIKLD